jgi:hypothetical protein
LRQPNARVYRQQPDGQRERETRGNGNSPDKSNRRSSRSLRTLARSICAFQALQLSSQAGVADAKTLEWKTRKGPPTASGDQTSHIANAPGELPDRITQFYDTRQARERTGCD